MTTDTTGIILDEIALSLHKELGLKIVCRLIGVFGDAGRVFSAGRDELVDLGGIPRGVAASLLSKSHHRQAVAEIEYCRRKGIVPVGVSSPLYPPLLRECCDFPVVLYTVGDPEALAGDMMAVVGTRKITPYGSVACEKLVGGLASAGYRITIVSGLAYGVDATAHRAALANGLPTVAVLGNSLPGIYPADNTGLARKIVERGGCLVTEYDSGAETRRSNFVARNRIIAGMSRGTLVVESPRKGGSMITAGIASGYDRLVMAVPGRITDENSTGTNFLIRSLGAVAVTCAADIAEEMELDNINQCGGKSLEFTPTAGWPGESQPDPVSVPDILPASDGGHEGSLGELPDAGNTGTRNAVAPASGSDTPGIPITDGTDRSHEGFDKESIVRQVTRMVFATQDVNNPALTGPENNTGYPAMPSPESSQIQKKEQDNNLKKETIQIHNPETRSLKSSGKLPGDSQTHYPEPGVNQPYDAEPSRNRIPDDSQINSLGQDETQTHYPGPYNSPSHNPAPENILSHNPVNDLSRLHSSVPGGTCVTTGASTCPPASLIAGNYAGPSAGPSAGSPAVTASPDSPVYYFAQETVTGDKARILEQIVACDGAGVDMLVERTGIPAPAMLAQLFELELAGMVRKSPGGTYMKI